MAIENSVEESRMVLKIFCSKYEQNLHWIETELNVFDKSRKIIKVFCNILFINIKII